jgi:hypothetical protein
MTSSGIIEKAQEAHINDRGVASEIVLSLTEITRKLPARFWKPSTVNRMQLMATAFSSAIWLVCSQHDDARRAADDTLSLMRKLGAPYRDITCLAAFYIVCQVFMNLGDMEKYYHCLEYLQEIGRTHGLGLLALRSLERIRLARELVLEQSEARVFQRLKILSVFELQSESPDQIAAASSENQSNGGFSFQESSSTQMAQESELPNLTAALDFVNQPADSTTMSADEIGQQLLSSNSFLQFETLFSSTTGISEQPQDNFRSHEFLLGESNEITLST